jgi:hypothetical protein
MSMRIPISGPTLLALLLAFALRHASAAPTDVDCFVQCRSAACLLAGPGDPQTIEKGAKVKHLESCGKWRIGAADQVVEGRFRSARGVEQFVVSHPGRNFAEAVPTLSKGLCSASRSCMESSDVARVAAVAGKGIGVGGGRRVGSPCAIGLPCGVVLRPVGALSIPLQSSGDAGVLRVTNLDSGASQQFAVRAGLVELPPSAWLPGAAYAYSLQDASGNVIAAGGFSVMSARMQADVEAELAALKARNPDAAGIDGIEILLDNELYWDAQLRSR